MKETMQGEQKAIKWNFTETLEDLDFADDAVLLSHRTVIVTSKAKAKILLEMLGKLDLKSTPPKRSLYE